jgi:hypothetical protein
MPEGSFLNKPQNLARIRRKKITSKYICDGGSIRSFVHSSIPTG